MTSKTITVGEIFDDISITPYQYRVGILCVLVTFLDGFDLTVIGVALPNIAEYLNTSPSSLGFALAAGQFGPLVGAIFLGMLADRFGRKWMLFFSALVFGTFTLLTPFITTVEQLGVYRFLAGIGLGGAIPNALAIASEYAPKRARSFIVSTMYAGMPAGAMTGGLLAAYCIPHFGWQSLFFIGGLAPIILSVFIAVALPESLEFLISRNKGKDKKRVHRIIATIAPKVAAIENVRFINTEKAIAGAPVKRLFTEGRAVTTLLLWVICSAALYMLWILNTWAPTLLRNSGATVQQYSLAYSFLCFGAVISSLFIGRTMDRYNPFRILQFGFVAATLSLVAFGVGASSGSFLVIAILSVVCGICINGSQTGTLAVATLSYPADIRGTAIGWTYAVAKIGAMLAPLVGGVLLSKNWSVSQICSLNALVGIFTAGMLLILQKKVHKTSLIKKNSWSLPRNVIEP
jgi:MFS transporter, AAHS family, 4-hydroxybenzoate transporter